MNVHLSSPDPALSGRTLARAAGEAIVVATPDAAWAATVLSALTLDLAPPAQVRRVDAMDALEAVLGDALPARLWVVDEAWIAPLLARRRRSPQEAAPGLLVRFQEFSTARVVAMIESGARGCLPACAGVPETRDAIRAVLDGELWLSRRLFSDVLAHLQERRRHEPPLAAPPDTEATGDDGLTARQRDIACCVRRGMSNKEIGRHLGISPTTVKTHLHNIFERLGVGGRTLLALRSNDPPLH